MGEDLAIRVAGLRMGYGRREVLHGIDLEVRRGEIFAFLGPNGAGKTTTVEILEGYRRRTGGDVEVLGSDPERGGAGWRERVGVVLQTCTPEPELTVAETVALYAGFYSDPRPVAEVIELVGLSEEATTRVEGLSGGQQRRLDVGLALVGRPELVFLDEPTTGFDPAARRAAWKVIADLRATGVTVFLTTHYLEEAEFLADRIAVIAGGRIVASGTPSTLGGRDRSVTRIRVETGPAAELPRLPATLARRATVAGGVVELATETPVADLAALCGWLERKAVEVASVDVRRSTLEETYLELIATGSPAEVGAEAEEAAR